MYVFAASSGHEKYCTIYEVVRPAARSFSILLMALLGSDDLVVVGVLQAFIAFIFIAGNFAIGKYMGKKKILGI